MPINTNQKYSIFDTNVRISDMGAFHPSAIWPKNVEICITRVPVRQRDGYSTKMINTLAQKLANSMVNNGIVFLVCYAPVENRARPFEIAKAMTEHGFTHIDNIISQKSWYPGKRSENMLVNSHEYVLHFCYGNVWKLDRHPVREYLGTDSSISCPGNTWKVETGSLDEAYPQDLSNLLVKMTDCLPGSIVFDPFMGTKSSLVTALNCGHSFYGFETNAKRMEKYKKVLKKFEKDRRV